MWHLNVCKRLSSLAKLNNGEMCIGPTSFLCARKKENSLRIFTKFMYFSCPIIFKFKKDIAFGERESRPEDICIYFFKPLLYSFIFMGVEDALGNNYMKYDDALRTFCIQPVMTNFSSASSLPKRKCNEVISNGAAKGGSCVRKCACAGTNEYTQQKFKGFGGRETVDP